MKRTILTMIAASGILVSATAQETKTGVRFIPRAGVNFTNVTWTYLGEELDTKIKTGFHIGADVEIPIADEFYLQPGLLFSTKGAKAEDADGDGKLNLSYIEVPVSFMYKPVLGEGRLILGAGPYVGIGVGGKVTEDGEDDIDVEFKSELSAADYDDSKAYLKRTDFGANLTVGYELSMGLVLQLNAQLGLTDNSTKFTDVPAGIDFDQKFKNTGFGLSVGYRF